MSDIEDFLLQKGIISDEKQLGSLKQTLLAKCKSTATEKLVKLEDMIALMESMGIQEKKPESKKHLVFERLDLKSRRLLNRLREYIEDNQTGV